MSPSDRTPPPPEARISEAAALLVALRQPGARPQSLPAECAPRTQAESYRVQHATQQLLRSGVAGWKVAMNDASDGTSAPVYADALYHAPATVPATITERLGIEPEISFSLARDLPPLAAGRHYARADVVDAVAAAHAAIEIVVSRFQSHEGAPPLDRLADNISNAGLVVGAGRADWRALDFARLPLRLNITCGARSQHEHQGQGGHPLADPVIALVWLANHLSLRGIGLHRGEFITTGSYAGLLYAPRASEVRVQFEGLGAVQLSCL